MSSDLLTATPLPSGVSPPPEVLNNQNQSGVIAIIAGFSLGLVLLSVWVKLYARKYFRNFRHDDITFALAIVGPQQYDLERDFGAKWKQGFVILQSSLVFYQIRHGLGVTLSDLTWDQRMTIRKARSPIRSSFLSLPFVF